MRNTFILLPLLLGTVFGNPAASQASQPANAVDDAEVFYAFMRQHAWLVSKLGEPTGDPPYGLTIQGFNAITRLAGQLESNLASNEAAFSTSGLSQLRTERFVRRRALIADVRASLYGMLSAAETAALNKHLSTHVAQSISVVSPTAGFCGVVVYVNDIVDFYNGGLGTRSETWFAGPTSCVPYVENVGTLLNNDGIAGPWNATASPGALAWAGYTTLNPVAGTYRQRANHVVRLGGSVSPPYSSGYIVSGGFTFDPQSGLGQYQTSVQISLRSSVSSESGKNSHFITTTNCSTPVTLTLSFTPPLGSISDAPPITWSGGAPGADVTKRIVACTSPGDTVVTASVGNQMSATATVHVVNARPDPTPLNQATFNGSSAGDLSGNGWVQFPCPTNGCNFGVTLYNGDGLAPPQYFDNVTAFLPSDRWIFRVSHIEHQYRQGLHPSIREDGGSLRTNLIRGDERPFPEAKDKDNCNCDSITSRHAMARMSLDVTNKVEEGPSFRYWIALATITAHEKAHSDRFYNLDAPDFWVGKMKAFQAQDIEASNVTVVYDCNVADTRTPEGAKRILKPNWDSRIVTLHAEAMASAKPLSELEAYRVSNPLVKVIYDRIPTGGAPAVASLSIANAVQGSSGTLYINGQNLNAAPVVKFSGSGISGSIASVSPSQIMYSYSIASNAAIGTQYLTVETDNGTTSAVAFTISTAPPPTTVSITVTGWQSGSTYKVGDSFTVYVHGQPGQPVYVDQNGGGLYYFGDTNWQGDRAIPGTWTSEFVGSYSQTWYVGATAAVPTLYFEIIP